MQRLLTIATLGGLLIATSAAFAVTERLKLTKSAVYGTKVSHSLSPTCGCARGRATVFFKLRRADDITVSVLNSREQEVALLTAQHYRHGPVKLRWNGRDDSGRRAPDGVYRVQIHLSGQHQTIDFPNRIQLDTKPPQVLSIAENRQIFSPDGDHQADFVRLKYTLSKPAHLALYLGTARVLYAHAHLKGSVLWRGTGPDDATLGPGTYTLHVGATDLDGNSTPVAQRQRVTLQIRYIQLASNRIVVGAGRRLVIGVSTDARSYSWKLGRRQGKEHSHVLVIRAPTVKGRYTLTVSERGHVSRAAVIVR